MSGFSVKPLDETTWPHFARLVERHNGALRVLLVQHLTSPQTAWYIAALENRAEKVSMRQRKPLLAL